ncbi:hypothetical protein AVR82_17170 (plasmid) [Lactiplantibacillus plantarum]|nr:hypothetical protein AVR82_17170 [Lactiplantibacillus plantarum]
MTSHNAEKVYSKEITAIKSYPAYNLFMNITEIHWQNWQQYRQFHPDNQRKVLHDIAREIKHTRLPSELIYYLGDARFLIISYRVDETRKKQLMIQPKKVYNKHLKRQLFSSNGLRNKLNIITTINSSTLLIFANSLIV